MVLTKAEGVFHVILYHGSNRVVDEPLIVKTKYAKDFGWGFYTTQNAAQAEKWVMRRASGFGGTPTVSSFEFTPSDKLLVLSFPDTTSEWLDFFAHCRNHGIHKYDIVEGPMVDDEVWEHVEDYLEGHISREECLTIMKYHHAAHQMSFHTISALSAISFVSSYKVAL